MAKRYPHFVLFHLQNILILWFLGGYWGGHCQSYQKDCKTINQFRPGCHWLSSQSLIQFGRRRWKWFWRDHCGKKTFRAFLFTYWYARCTKISFGFEVIVWKSSHIFRLQQWRLNFIPGNMQIRKWMQNLQSRRSRTCEFIYAFSGLAWRTQKFAADDIEISPRSKVYLQCFGSFGRQFQRRLLICQT